MNRHILIVDDDPHIREILVYALEKAGMKTSQAKHGVEALSLFKQHSFDLIVLDIHMPEMDGLQLCREIRKTSEIPILFLSSRDEEIDRVLGLELGGDDYVTKPFSTRELTARIQAILKRTQPAPQPSTESPCLQHGLLTLDMQRHFATWNNQPVDLTALEFSILSNLLKHPERVFNRDQIMDKSYAQNVHVSDRTIDSHIRHIREKCARLGCTTIIETIRSVGYRLGSCT